MRDWNDASKAYEAIQVCKSRCYQEISLRVETAYKQPLYVEEEPKAAWEALKREYGHFVSGFRLYCLGL